MKLTIQVTADDIAQGKMQSAVSCPVALALRRITGLRAYVLSRWVSLVSDDYCGGCADVVTVFSPPEVMDFVTSFDFSRSAVVPTELTFEVPDNLYETNNPSNR